MSADWSAQSEEQLLRLIAERYRRDQEAMRLYRPMPMQAAFHRSLASERICRGGNRAGKSVCAAAEVASAATGVALSDNTGERLPFWYPKDEPIRIWVIGYDEKHIARIYRKLFWPDQFRIIKDAATGEMRAWRPWEESDKARESETKPAPPFIPARFYDPKDIAWDGKNKQVFTIVRLKNGTSIEAFPSGGVPGQGEPVHLIWIDEDIQIPDQVDEWQARLSDARGFPAPLTGGRLIWSVWPHTRNSALLSMSKRAKAQKDRKNPDIEEWVLTMSGNPYVDENEKRKRIEGWGAKSSALVRSRDQGEFILDEFLVFPQFNIDVHGIPSAGRPDKLEQFLRNRGFQVPVEWTNYLILDPGHRQPCVLLAAVPPPHDFGDQVVIWDEVYEPKINANEMAEILVPKVQGRAFEAFIIDWHAGRRTQEGVGLTIKQIYTDAFEAAGVVTKTGKCHFQNGSDDVNARNLIVADWLAPQKDTGYPKLRLLSYRTPGTQNEFGLYCRRVTKDDVKEAVVDAHNHAMSNLGYLAAYNPQYVYADPLEAPTHPAIRAWQKLEGKKEEPTTVWMGAGSPPAESPVDEFAFV